MVQKEKISSEQHLCGRKCLVDVRGQRRMGRLVRDDRKATVTQITTRYNQCLQNIISEHTTRRTLKQMGYSSRRPHRVPLLSGKNRKQRRQFTQAHQSLSIEDWKNVAWSDESWFLLRHSDGRVRIWRKIHESMDPSSLVLTVHITWFYQVRYVPGKTYLLTLVISQSDLKNQFIVFERFRLIISVWCSVIHLSFPLIFGITHG